MNICPECGINFDDEWLLIAHIDLMHPHKHENNLVHSSHNHHEYENSSYLLCNVCGVWIEDRVLFDFHNELYHSTEDAKEPMTNDEDLNSKAFSGIDSYIGPAHSSYLCNVCGVLIEDRVLFDFHNELYHSNQEAQEPMQIDNDLNSKTCSSTNSYIGPAHSSYLCIVCGELFEDYILFDNHKELHRNIEEVQEPMQIDEDLNIEMSCSTKYPNNAMINTNNISASSSNEREKTGCGLKTKERQDICINQSEHTNRGVIETYAESLDGVVVRHYRIRNVNNYQIETFLTNSQTVIVNTLKNELKRLNCVKFNILLDATFTNIDGETSIRGFIARSRSIIKTTNLEDVVQECFQELIIKLTEHESRGSGWSLLQVNSMDVRVHKQGYGDRGSSYIPLPKKISDTKSCINVQNQDNECFKYAMLTKFIHDQPNFHPKNINKFSSLSNKYNFSGVNYPVSLKDIVKFEKCNVGVSVNVFGLDDSQNVYPLKIVNTELRDHSDLLLLKDGDVSHYVYIKDFNRLVARQLRRKNKHALIVCKRCLCYVSKSNNRLGVNWLSEHMRICGKHQEVRIDLPLHDRANLMFNKVSHQYRIPIVLYADFEATLISVDDVNNAGSRFKYQKHEPNSYALMLKSTLTDDQLEYYNLTSKPKIYRGENVAKHFIDELYDIAAKVEILYSHMIPMEELTDYQQAIHEAAAHCYICDQIFTELNPKVKDHDHLTGEYRGPACNSCNINYKLPKFIPVVLHNLQKYDSHMIIPELGRDSGSIDVLATTNENFISFSKKVGKMKLKFIDSYKFMSCSLQKLTENLQRSNLVETRKLVPEDKLDLVIRKGVFCYDYIDSLERFNETSLPPIEKFYSKLTEEDIDPSDYQHACRVWDEMKFKNLGEYNDFYVSLDVTLLCDIMEEFRNTCFKAYGLDPLYYCTAPGLAWQAMLKQTKCNLQLLTDIDMLLMIESGIRGGITQSITRRVKANNKYLADYNPNEESIFLGYFDANNLYGWAMSKPLPYGEFKWVDPCNIGDILQIQPDGEVGYFLECDIEYNEALHDHHYDLPLLPRSETPPGKKHKKLMTTLCNKTKYVAHYLIIQQAIQLGLKVSKIHRAIQFKQSCWLKPYIDSNTSRRTKANSTFEKDFYKLMNNAIFGKTLENKRKHKNVKLVTDARKLEKLAAKPNFNTSIIINENLVAVCMDKTSIKMDRPLYVGMSILDISKTLMYDFHYNKMVKYFGRDNIGICYMDTDSYVYWIKTDDMYYDLKVFPYNNDFDFSDYPKTHLLYDNQNKKVIGKFKDEANGNLLKEIIALASKMYAIEFEELNCIKKAKGIKNSFVKKNITFANYKHCLEEHITYTATFNNIRSFNHQLFSVRETKKSLSPYDDKRVILQDGIHTLPYGHYSLR